MSILYGRKGFYRLATWKQKPDDHWFGGNVPGKLISVDTVSEISKEKLSVLP
jgi:hypothetical protein